MTRMFPRSNTFLRIASLLACSLAGIGARCSAAPAVPTSQPTASPVVASSTQVRPLRLIVGFMGGRVKPGNLLHREATIAQDLRGDGAQDLHVLVYANHNSGAALAAVLKLIDQNGDHHISEQERQAVDIAIYGHSWGASETVALARCLQREHIPIALTIQVDSVQKHGENDAEIPSNVENAVNLYQRDGLLRGRPLIYAQDPTKTHILLNEQIHYNAHHSIDIARFPWFARTFMRQHIMIENDPEVWSRVETLLREAVGGQPLQLSQVRSNEQPE